MKQLLDKFRIPVSDVIVIPDITTPPSENTKAWFELMINNLIRLDSDPTINNTNDGNNTLTHIFILLLMKY